MKNLFTCKDISKITTSEKRLSFIGKLKFRFHIFICHDCQNFVKSMYEVSKLAKNCIEEKMKISDEEISRVEDEILKSMKK